MRRRHSGHQSPRRHHPRSQHERGRRFVEAGGADEHQPIDLVRPARGVTHRHGTSVRAAGQRERHAAIRPANALKRRPKRSEAQLWTHDCVHRRLREPVARPIEQQAVVAVRAAHKLCGVQPAVVVLQPSVQKDDTPPLRRAHPRRARLDVGGPQQADV